MRLVVPAETVGRLTPFTKEITMLHLPVTRMPFCDHSYFAKTFEATLSVEQAGTPCNHQHHHRWLELGFSSNPNGQKVSLFRIPIFPRHFAQIARMMVEAHPTAAIQAFGAALQAAEAESQRPEAGAEETEMVKAD